MTVKIGKERENIYISNSCPNTHYGMSFDIKDLPLIEVLRLLWYKLSVEVEFLIWGFVIGLGI